MTIILYGLLFIISCGVLAYAGEKLVDALSRIASVLKWNEFVVSFFLMSFATSLPELTVGISSALRGIPELSFGNIVGQNIIHFTLAMALCAFIVGHLDVKNKVISVASNFTFLIALVPVLLILDGKLSRMDGVLLIFIFLLYTIWLFSKKEHFVSEFRVIDEPKSIWRKMKVLFISLFSFLFGAFLLLASTQGIIVSSMYISKYFVVPIAVVGTLIVGLGTALPETYFSITSARKGNTGMLVGNLLGATAISASLVLGIVAIMNPIVVGELNVYLVNRLFLLASAVLFWIFLKTGKKITTKEALVLLCVYLLFVFAEVATHF